MLLWFPTPYPGESLYSLIARYHELSGNYLVCDSIGQLFGDKRLASSPLIPYRLGYLAQQTEKFGLNFETLLHEYTLYDYFLLFGSKKNRHEVSRILQTNSGEAYNAMLGIYGNQNNPKYLRFCPQCMAEERNKYGEAYWHNLHQAPGMLCCETHGCLLVDSSIPMPTRSARNYVALETITLFPIAKGNGKTLEISWELSRDIAYLWDNRLRFRSQWDRLGESFSDCYLTLAKGKGFATEGGTVRRHLLLDAIQNKYSQDLLDDLNASITTCKPWPITLCQHGRQIQSTVKNILLAKLFCGDLCTFLEFIENLQASPSPRKSLNYSKVTDLERLSPYRAKWEQLLSEKPQASRNELIHSAPSVHLWLKRHDHDWLMEHYPPPLKRGGNIAYHNWEQRDTEYLPRIKALSKTWRQEQQKPIRITKARFFHELGIVSSLSEKLPLSMELISSSIESVHEWDQRRMKWAIREMQKNNEPIILWRVIRKAGICESRRKECEDFLKHSGWLSAIPMQEVSGSEI